MGPGPCVILWVVVFDGDEGAYYRRRRFTPRKAVRLLCTQRPVRLSHDLWAWGLMSETGQLWCAPCEIFRGARGASGRVFLERGFALRVAVTLLHFLRLLRPLVYRSGVPNPPMRAPEFPPRPSAPRTRAKGLQTVLPPRVVPGGRRERGGTDCAAPTGLSSHIRPLIGSPQKCQRTTGMAEGVGSQAGARRGASVLHQHHRQTRRHRHRHHHHHLVRRRHPRGSSSKNNSNSSRGSGCPASRVTGRFRAPSKCSSFFTGLVIISMDINPSFAYQGLFPLYSQSRSHQ
jgi:hypothetical protein